MTTLTREWDAMPSLAAVLLLSAALAASSAARCFKELPVAENKVLYYQSIERQMNILTGEGEESRSAGCWSHGCHDTLFIASFIALFIAHTS